MCIVKKGATRVGYECQFARTPWVAEVLWLGVGVSKELSRSCPSTSIVARGCVRVGDTSGLV